MNHTIRLIGREEAEAFISIFLEGLKTHWPYSEVESRVIEKVCNLGINAEDDLETNNRSGMEKKGVYGQ